MSVREIERRAKWSTAHLRDAREAMAGVADQLRGIGRVELADAIVRHRDRLGVDVRTRVVLAGEFKAGKTALVNALIGQTLLVDDPLVSTAVPVEVEHGEEPAYRRILLDGEAETISLEQLRHLAVGTDPDDLSRTSRLTARVPSPFLAAGIVLIDTPSLSAGLASPAAAAVLGFIQVADAVLLVTDAGQELTASQAELLGTIAAIGDPLVACALTKTDLHLHWDRVAAVDRGRLDELGVEGALMPVSTALYAAGCLEGSSEAIQESGIPQLRWYLANTLLADVLQRQSGTGLATVAGLLDEARASIEAEAGAAADAADLARLEEGLESRRQRLDRLTTGLQGQVQHQVGLFANDVGSALDRRLAELSDFARAVVEQGDPSRSWPAIQARVYEAGNTMVAEHLVYLDTRMGEVVTAVSDYLAVEAGRLRLDDRPQARAEVERPGDRPDVGEIRRGVGGRISAYDVVRGSMGGLLTATGTVGTLGSVAQAAGLISLSAVALPFALVTIPVGAAGTAWTVKTMVARRRESDLDAGRRLALEEIARYVKVLGQQLRDDSRKVQWRLRTWLTETLNAEVPALRSELGEEIERMAAVRAATASDRRTITSGRRAALADLDLHLTQVRNLLYTMARPELAPVRR